MAGGSLSAMLKQDTVFLGLFQRETFFGGVVSEENRF